MKQTVVELRMPVKTFTDRLYSDQYPIEIAAITL